MGGAGALDTSIVRPVGYWQHLERVISVEVDAALGKNEDARRPLITYLRDLQKEVRAEGDRRQTVQIIASGRRLLGDGSNGRTAESQRARSMSAVP